MVLCTIKYYGALQHEFGPAPAPACVAVAVGRVVAIQSFDSYYNLATSGSDVALAWRSNQMTVSDDVALVYTKGCDDSKGCDLSR